MRGIDLAEDRQSDALGHSARRRKLGLDDKIPKLTPRSLGRIEADQITLAIHEKWDAKIGLGDCQFLDNCLKQALADNRRDVVQVIGDVGLRLQKLDRPMTMWAVRLKEDMQAPITLPSNRGRIWRHQSCLELQAGKDRQQYEDQHEADAGRRRCSKTMSGYCSLAVVYHQVSLWPAALEDQWSPRWLRPQSCSSYLKETFTLVR